MTEVELPEYCNLMEQVKRRTSVIHFFFSGQGHALYEAMTIESVALQLRKILELVAFASLVANKDLYSKAHEDFAKHWNARLLLRDIERINSEFYPKPVVEAPTKIPGVLHQLDERNVDYLTKDEFENVYEKCGAIMHSENPYGSRIDFGYYREKLPVWETQVRNLLNNHVVHLVGQQGFHIIHMKEERDERVHAYTFVPRPPSGTQ